MADPNSNEPVDDWDPPSENYDQSDNIPNISDGVIPKNDVNQENDNATEIRDLIKEGKTAPPGVGERRETSSEEPATSGPDDIKKDVTTGERRKPKCSYARWSYLENGGSEKMIDRESMILEIKHWMFSGDDLDEEAQKFHNEELAHFNFPRALQDDIPSSLDEYASDEEAVSAPTFLKSLYIVNRNNTKLRAIYWRADTKELTRGTHFKSDSTPIEPIKAAQIENHLDKPANYERKKTDTGEVIIVPKPLLFNGDRFAWSTLVKFTVQKKGNKYVEEVFQCNEGMFRTPAYKPNHLIFVVHGIWHNEKEQSIVGCAQKLNKGVDKEAKTSSELLFIPIHWRTQLKKHKCNKKCAKDKAVLLVDYIPFLKDVAMYCCSVQAKEIRQIVVQKMKRAYAKFIVYNPGFTGNVSFFGHSLGSVICYDILSKERLGADHDPFKFKVTHLFTIGSPLRRFIDCRGEPARVLFRETIKTIRIHNVYHPKDKVAQRLEPLLHKDYEYLPVVQLPTFREQDKVYVATRSIAKPVWKFFSNAVKYVRTAFRPRVDPDGLFLGERIDYQLQKNPKVKEIQPHSIYWEHVAIHQFMLTMQFTETVHCYDSGSSTQQENENTPHEEVFIDEQIGSSDMEPAVTVATSIDEQGMTMIPILPGEESIIFNNEVEIQASQQNPLKNNQSEIAFFILVALLALIAAVLLVPGVKEFVCHTFTISQLLFVFCS